MLIAFLFGRTEAQNNILSDQEIKAGWQLLFDGKTFTGWRSAKTDTVPTNGWKIENGELITIARDNRTLKVHEDLITIAQYSNFEFQFEFKMEKDLNQSTNSGVKYFVQTGTSLGLEYQIIEELKEVKYPGELADLYELFSAKNKKVNPMGTWNQGKIVVQGKQVEHWLNGIQVLEFERGGKAFLEQKAKSKFKDIKEFGEFPQGHILLQDHGGGVSFRNLKIRVL
jgi:hypothetical protein